MKLFLARLIIFFMPIVFLNCSSSPNNSVTFQNMSSGDVYINFRGQMITIPAGKTSSVKNIPNGTYSYSTTYSVPAGVTSTNSQGNVSGTLQIKVGTKILFVYSSTMLSGTYTIYVTISNSDDQSSSTPTGP